MKVYVLQAFSFLHKRWVIIGVFDSYDKAAEEARILNLSVLTACLMNEPLQRASTLKESL